MAEHLKIMNKRMVLLNPVPKAHNICQKFTNRQTKTASPDNKGLMEEGELNDQNRSFSNMDKTPLKNSQMLEVTAQEETAPENQENG